MTIDESIEVLIRHKLHWEHLSEQGICDVHEGKETISAFTIALASLEAWDEIKREINDLFSTPACYMPNYDAYKMFLEIIDKHLQDASPTGVEGRSEE